MRRRKVLFAALCICLAGVVSAYVYRAKGRFVDTESAAAPTARLVTPARMEPAPAKKQEPLEVQPPEPVKVKKPEPPPEPPRKDPRIFFRHNGLDSNYGRVGVIGGPAGGPPEFAGLLRCEVLNVAAGRGICLTANRGVVTTYAAELFDATTFEKTGTIRLKGGPSRCRVSRDGRFAALTVFVSGHSYTSLNFSTQTLIVDTRTAAVLADVETFAVTRDGIPFHNADFNFWGVSFTPKGDQFYCTLSSQGRHYLVKGDIASRQATVLRENVECPSLSPDATRIAYKKRLPSQYRVTWQLHVLDLASGSETPLEEKRSVDDQLEWLDNDRVLYALPLSETTAGASTNVWVAAVNGSESPRLFLTNAYSPSVERR